MPARTSSAPTAAAVAEAQAEAALQARLEAAVESLLAEIGLDCTPQMMTRAESDACSEFEMVSRTASDPETALITDASDAKQWLGPAVHLIKTTSAPLDSASLDSAESAAFYSPGLQSVTAASSFQPFKSSQSLEQHEDFYRMNDDMASSSVSVGDVQLDMAGSDSGLTVQEGHPAAVCFAATHNGISTAFDDSASEAGSCGESVLSLVSASTFGDDSEETAADSGTPDEWEII